MIYELLGKNVREGRTNKGLTMADLAKKTGLTEDRLGEIEGGEPGTSIVELMQLAKALSTTTDFLLREHDSSDPAREALLAHIDSLITKANEVFERKFMQNS